MRLTRLGAIILAIALINSVSLHGSAAVADATVRQVEREYLARIVPTAVDLRMFPCTGDSPRGCVQIVPRDGERFLHVSLADQSGMGVYGYVNQDIDGDGRSDLGGPFCGKTMQPVRVKPGSLVKIFVLAHYDYCPTAAATRGTATITVGTSFEAVRRAVRG